MNIPVVCRWSALAPLYRTVLLAETLIYAEFILAVQRNEQSVFYRVLVHLYMKKSVF